MAFRSKQKKHRGFAFYLGRVITAAAGLVLGFALFVWQALASIDYVGIEAVDRSSSEGMDAYYHAEDAGERSKMGEISVKVDPDYPIYKVKQKDRAVENFLVFGLDSRGEGESARADSIIILTLDKRNGSIKLTSILRDTEAGMNQKDGKRAKINASYAYGGVGMLINSLNANFGLDINKFVMFDFWSAVRFVDALGGVELDIQENEIQAANQVMYEMAAILGRDPAGQEISKAGRQRLNGLQAISWARVRYIDSDFGRTSRQRILMESILDSFSRKNLFAKASFMIDVLPELETNIKRADIVSNAFSAAGALNHVEQYSVPQQGMYTTNRKNWNLIIDEEQQIPALHKFIWGRTGGE